MAVVTVTEPMCLHRIPSRKLDERGIFWILHVRTQARWVVCCECTQINAIASEIGKSLTGHDARGSEGSGPAEARVIVEHPENHVDAAATEVEEEETVHASDIQQPEQQRVCVRVAERPQGKGKGDLEKALKDRHEWEQAGVEKENCFHKARCGKELRNFGKTTSTRGGGLVLARAPHCQVLTLELLNQDCSLQSK
jgi:hypothetical protein